MTYLAALDTAAFEAGITSGVQDGLQTSFDVSAGVMPSLLEFSFIIIGIVALVSIVVMLKNKFGSN